ncbi:baseplate J/gp47 family protein [Chromobacterium subtsugae]|uniref:baseplate assembly protein n=1 Tax=Chromobacterium subtsugae TaxID=251747 RepID=UPI0006417A4E|nr:baseplate J/gp47 family protein [Chromobacterium subtsugae]
MTGNLPRFVDDDPQTITAQLLARYEAMSGKTLYPGHVDRIMIDLIASVAAQKSAEINDSARLNLLAFSRGAILDHLGQLVATARLAARPARTTLRFSRGASQPEDMLIPAGTRVASGDGRIAFFTGGDAKMQAGVDAIEVDAIATVSGVEGNGWLPGQINALQDFSPGIASAVNSTVSSGGADEEDDERYRQRIRLAPERFSVAGPVGAYRFHALQASQDIIDVAVSGGGRDVPPGVVRVYPLCKRGLPSAEVLAAVLARCSHDKARPLTDQVEVLPPREVPYRIVARVTLLAFADEKTVNAALQSEGRLLVERLATGLGRDIVPSQISAALATVPGVYRVDLRAPSALRALAPYEWARCDDLDIRIEGRADD